VGQHSACKFRLHQVKIGISAHRIRIQIQMRHIHIHEGGPDASNPISRWKEIYSVCRKRQDTMASSILSGGPKSQKVPASRDVRAGTRPSAHQGMGWDGICQRWVWCGHGFSFACEILLAKSEKRRGRRESEREGEGKKDMITHCVCKCWR